MPWYCRMLASCEVVKLGRAEPIAWNAELLGAKIVTSDKESTVSTSLARVKAPATPLKPALMAVSETLSGIVKTESMI